MYITTYRTLRCDLKNRRIVDQFRACYENKYINNIILSLARTPD
jgi:hypothetical protein